MGLDAVEIILRCEEVFGIAIPDDEAGQIDTVGQLFELICGKLALPSGTAAPTGFGTNRLTRRFQLAPWTREDAWATLIGICCDQMGLDPEDIWYNARIGADLGID